VLNFALGNQLAQQGRWAEAQQEYFKAAAAEPDNADFAYNLAVSLDHLRQPRLAREHYLRAIALAEKRGAGFDLAAARTRAAQLEK
jgi:Flp pilus assembly protein TadD